MKYIYSNAALPRDSELLFKINSAAERLAGKLSRIDLECLGISEYTQKYLGSKLANPVGSLQLYSYLLALSLSGNKRPLDRFVFVDYGGGSGILSLLAKELGIGKVIYNDIYDTSCEDMRKLSKAIGIDIDGYVCGGIDELLAYVKKQPLPVNAISSYDVIEHIYDIEGYLRKLRSLSGGSLRVVFGSGANIKNPGIRLLLRRTHLKVEHQERKREWGHKERDTLKDYLSARKEIINNHDPELQEDAVGAIAKSTRGLIKQDIEKCVDEYKATGKISYEPDHPTNTCDPYTGNWAERLMKTEWLKSLLIEEGFAVKILSGYWAYSKRIYIRLIKDLLNMAIKRLGRTGLFLSPYYVVYADRNV